MRGTLRLTAAGFAGGGISGGFPAGGGKGARDGFVRSFNCSTVDHSSEQGCELHASKVQAGRQLRKRYNHLFLCTARAPAC